MQTVFNTPVRTNQPIMPLGICFQTTDSASSRILRKKYNSEIAQHYWGKNAKLWHDSKCIISCEGAPLEVIKQYFDNQSGGKE